MKDRILKEACRLFAEYGYDAVSTRRIAEAANVRDGSLRYHFANKETLYAQVFRKVYDLDNALTYDVLLSREPTILETAEGKAYAIKRIVFDYFQRHVFIPEKWRRKLIHRELANRSLTFCRHVEKELKEEREKMVAFYFLLRPDGNLDEAVYWAYLPDTQGLYHFMAGDVIGRQFDRDFKIDMDKTVVKNTAKIMIAFLNLPVPSMLD